LFADPFVLVVGAPTGATTAVALTGAGAAFMSFACISRGPTSSTYRYVISSTHWVDLFVGHQEGKRNRSTVRLTERELVTDPMDSSINSIKVSSCYFVADVGVLGSGTNWAGLLHALSYLLYGPSDAVQIAARVVSGET
jgi:hypothetical protein